MLQTTIATASSADIINNNNKDGEGEDAMPLSVALVRVLSLVMLLLGLCQSTLSLLAILDTGGADYLGVYFAATSVLSGLWGILLSESHAQFNLLGTLLLVNLVSCLVGVVYASIHLYVLGRVQACAQLDVNEALLLLFSNTSASSFTTSTPISAISASSSQYPLAAAAFDASRCVSLLLANSTNGSFSSAVAVAGAFAANFSCTGQESFFHDAAECENDFLLTGTSSASSGDNNHCGCVYTDGDRRHCKEFPGYASCSVMLDNLPAQAMGTYVLGYMGLSLSCVLLVCACTASCHHFNKHRFFGLSLAELRSGSGSGSGSGSSGNVNGRAVQMVSVVPQHAQVQAHTVPMAPATVVSGSPQRLRTNAVMPEPTP
eukprot:CAMPEP_0181316434 /NCGR_PEP_ID=MMETSP1101-20121128/15891_1 /TAXON_ID=46948 /ORGANISM="Rhodomonas abbreviata, Strain Caron Lab Isolate" /LENGTH=374 /DNA_ID=CAMNT_0023423677 /DNA_START=372 /DNA_END=1496 /DNA_ORIENTATION=+